MNMLRSHPLIVGVVVVLLVVLIYVAYSLLAAGGTDFDPVMR
ncbi:hypothetical protein ACFQI3_03205 [Hansschlegelia quercus]|nr:hypothetical protein [Hansschlegelia quercus]